MASEVVDGGNSVKVIFTDSDGNSARATVVGESVESVESRIDEIIEANNLREIAKQNSRV